MRAEREGLGLPPEGTLGRQWSLEAQERWAPTRRIRRRSRSRDLDPAGPPEWGRLGPGSGAAVTDRPTPGSPGNSPGLEAGDHQILGRDAQPQQHLIIEVRPAPDLRYRDLRSRASSFEQISPSPSVIRTSLNGYELNGYGLGRNVTDLGLTTTIHAMTIDGLGALMCSRIGCMVRNARFGQAA